MTCTAWCFFAGLVCFSQLWRYYVRFWVSRSWPETAGTILSAKVAHETTGGGQYPEFLRWFVPWRYRINTGSQTLYFAAFEIAYEAAGAPVKAAFRMNNPMDAEKAAETDLLRHPVGAIQPVRYNPANPQEYFIAETRVNLGKNFGTWRVIGLLIIGFGLIIGSLDPIAAYLLK